MQWTLHVGQLWSREASETASDCPNHSRSCLPRAVSSHPSPHKHFPSTPGKSRAVISPGSSPSLVELGIIQNMDSSPSPSPGFIWPLITQIFEARLCKEVAVQRDGAEICSAIRKGRWPPNFTLGGGGLSMSHVEGAAPGVLPSGLGCWGSPLLFWGHELAAKGGSGRRHWVASPVPFLQPQSLPQNRAAASRGQRLAEHPETPQLPARITPGSRALQKLSSACEIASLKPVSISH